MTHRFTRRLQPYGLRPVSREHELQLMIDQRTQQLNEAADCICEIIEQVCRAERVPAHKILGLQRKFRDRFAPEVQP